MSTDNGAPTLTEQQSDMRELFLRGFSNLTAMQAAAYAQACGLPGVPQNSGISRTNVVNHNYPAPAPPPAAGSQVPPSLPAPAAGSSLLKGALIGALALTGVGGVGAAGAWLGSRMAKPPASTPGSVTIGIDETGKLINPNP